MSNYTVHGNGSNCAVLPESGLYGNLVMDCSNGPIKLCGGGNPPYVLHGQIDNSAGCTVTVTGDWVIYYPANEPSAEDWFTEKLGGADISGATFTYEAETSGGGDG